MISALDLIITSVMGGVYNTFSTYPVKKTTESQRRCSLKMVGLFFFTITQNNEELI